MLGSESTSPAISVAESDKASTSMESKSSGRLALDPRFFGFAPAVAFPFSWLEGGGIV